METNSIAEQVVRLDAGVDERGRIPDARDTLANEVSAQREARIGSICAAADLRDDHAAVRDFEADQRDRVANFEAFARGVDDEDAFAARELAHRDTSSDRQAAGPRGASP